MREELLVIKDLHTHFSTYEGTARVLEGVNLSMKPGEFLGIVGETGCGKSVMGLSVLKLLPRNGRIVSGDILLKGESLGDKGEGEMTRIRGKRASMIFQHPQASLNPVFTLGEQISAIIRNNLSLSRRETKALALSMFEKVGLPDPLYLYGKYPHELSGGMQQRVMIAIALSCSPELIIADEPTTALDVTIQAQILSLMKKLREETGMGVMLITHSMGVVAKTCDRIVIMYAGQVAESGSVDEIFRNPLHPYTQGLLGSIPSYTQKERLSSIPGSICNLINPPGGCRFHPRCSRVMEICRSEKPQDLEYSSGEHRISCHLYSEERL